MNPSPPESAAPSAADAPAPVGVTAPDFRDVYQANVRPVWRALSAFGVPLADVPDAVQEVFLVVHRRLPDFDGRHKVSTWIHSISVRVAMAARRRAAARRETLVEEPADVLAQGDPESDLDARRAMAMLRELLDALDDDKRAVFVLYEVQELPMREVAEAVGCPLQTAYSRYHAARKVIDRELARRQSPTEVP